MKLRTYEPSDQDAVWTLHNLALDGAGANHPGPWDNDLDRSRHSISMKEPPRRDELRSMVLDAGRCDGCRKWVGGAATS